MIGSLAGGWLIELSGVKTMLIAGMAAALLATVVICISVKMYHRECRQNINIRKGQGYVPAEKGHENKE